MNKALVTTLLYSAAIAFVLAYFTAKYQKRRGYRFFPIFFNASIGYFGLILLIVEVFL